MLQQLGRLAKDICEILSDIQFTGSESTNTFVGQGMCNAMKIGGSLFDADDKKLEECAQFFSLHHGHSGHSTIFVHYTNHICYKLLPQECTNRLSSTNPKCIQLPCGPSILLGLHLVITTGC